MPTHIDTAFVRYACNCYVDPSGWHPRDSEPNGNTRDLDRAALRTAIARVAGVRDTDESPRVVEKLRAARSRGTRAADFDKMVTAKLQKKDEQGNDGMVWSAPPGQCPLHGDPVALSMVADYDAPDVVPEDLGVIDALRR